MPMTQADISKYKTLYLQAAKDNLDKLQENLFQLLHGAESEELYENMHREVHSLKSESLLMGYNHIGNLAAAIEVVFEQRKETNSSLSRDKLALIELCVQKMQASLSRIEKDDKELDLSNELKQLQLSN